MKTANLIWVGLAIFLIFACAQAGKYEPATVSVIMATGDAIDLAGKNVPSTELINRFGSRNIDVKGYASTNNGPALQLAGGTRVITYHYIVRDCGGNIYLDGIAAFDYKTREQILFFKE